MNGYRPIVELMNTNFGIYGYAPLRTDRQTLVDRSLTTPPAHHPPTHLPNSLAEISSAGNTYATTGGQFFMPMTIIGAGGTAPNQALGAEHSQPFHAYVMGKPTSLVHTHIRTGTETLTPLPINQPPPGTHTPGIPGLKICTAASPYAAYGLTKSMIRDNGPGILFLPVKLMKARRAAYHLA